MGSLRPLWPELFFNDTATTEIYTLSLHDALPISAQSCAGQPATRSWPGGSHQEPAPTAISPASGLSQPPGSSPPPRWALRLTRHVAAPSPCRSCAPASPKSLLT